MYMLLYTYSSEVFTSFPFHFQIYQLANEIGYYVPSVIINMLEMQNKEHIKGNDRVMTHAQMLNFSSDKQDKKCLLTLAAHILPAVSCHYCAMERCRITDCSIEDGYIDFCFSHDVLLVFLSHKSALLNIFMYWFIGLGLKICRHLKVKRGKIMILVFKQLRI